MFWRVSALFGIEPEKLLRMPLRIFWSAGRHVDRIAAWQDKRSLEVALAAQSAQGGDSWRSFHESLSEGSGIVVEPGIVQTSKAEILKITGG